MWGFLRNKGGDYQLARFRAAKSQPLVIASLVPPMFQSGQGWGRSAPVLLCALVKRCNDHTLHSGLICSSVLSDW